MAKRPKFDSATSFNFGANLRRKPSKKAKAAKGKAGRRKGSSFGSG
jgi:hypothetical protein